MPRAKQGGIRQGQPGGQYPNRADLRAPGNETVKGQPYGQAAAQQAAQRVIPLTPPSGPGAAPPGPGGPSAGPSGPGMAPAVSSSPQQGKAPGSLGPLTGPTQRPGEPLTAGLPVGPGPGPEAISQIPLGMVAQNMAPSDTTAALLANLASRPDAGATVRALAQVAANGPVRG
jgi:hypothetical protein